MSVRLYLSVVAVAEDVETILEWGRTQAAVHRKDRDVIDIDARLVVEDEDGRRRCDLITFDPLPLTLITDHSFRGMSIWLEEVDMCSFRGYDPSRDDPHCGRPAAEHEEVEA